MDTAQKHASVIIDQEYLAKGSQMVMLLFLGGYLINYLFNIFLSQVLGPAQYGNFKVAEAFYFLSCLITMLGGATAAPQLLRNQLNTEDVPGTWEYLRFYGTAAILASIVVGALVMAGHWLHIMIFRGTGYHPLIVATLVVPLAAISNLMIAIFQVIRRLDIAYLPWNVGYPALGLVFCGSYYLITGSLDSFTAVLLICGVTICMIIHSIFYLRRLKLMPFRRKQNFVGPNQWIYTSLPMMGIVSLQMLLRQVDIYMLELLGSETEVGFFAAAQTTAYAITIVKLALTGLLAPVVVLALEEGGDAIQELNYQGFRLTLMFTLPVVMCIIVFGHPILHLFGHNSHTAYFALVILTIGLMFFALTVVAALWLRYCGYSKMIVLILGATVVMNIALNVVLIPRYGIEGAATATTVSLLFSSGVFTVMLYRRFGFFPWSASPYRD
ncbi:Uncharacterised protein [BD1-7 clade bacterium]|uniref:Polysaccharide biosynthesis protein C-terminal domain-containing protein n=1 Tax=BD1-7 clade bacterium TaxID=2029982 RepID=A0A5S9PKN7_9GAMM|nr:Uncharacterised protein [BD1-7 clade bacterium]CAA0104835.1 Uncharacterised protein [BD1-7 clade bacterium]